MTDLPVLLIFVVNGVLTLLGSGGLVAYVNHRMQHRIAMLQQELAERKQQADQQQADREFGLASLREVLEARQAELERIRAELDECTSAREEASELRRERDLLSYQLHAAEDATRAWKEREAKYRASEDMIARLELEAYQRTWKEKLIIEQVARNQTESRRLRLENRKLKQRLGIPTEETAELPALELIGDVRRFLQSEDGDDTEPGT